MSDENEKRFAQFSIEKEAWSSSKEKELLSLQEQNKSHEDYVSTLLKAKREKELENSELKTKVDQLDRELLKKAKEVDSLKKEKLTWEERFNKQSDNDKRKSKAKDKNIDELEKKLKETMLKKETDERDNEYELSDSNRPQRLTEKFNCLYDNSWTDAYEILLAQNKDEKTICKILIKILEVCWKYCSALSKHQFSSLQKACMEPFTLSTEIKEDSSAYTKQLSDARKACAPTFIPLMCQYFWEKEMNKDHKKDEKLKPYVDDCLSLFWHSAITEPALYFSFTADDLDDFRAYTKCGDEVDFFVWPAMYLHENGPLLYQGVVQYK